MAKESKEKYLARCRGRISGAKKYRENEQLDKLWERLINLYRGKHFDDSSSEDRIAINYSKSIVDAIAASVANNHPKIVVQAQKPEDGDKAVILEAVTNYWWRTYNVRDDFELAVKDMLILGFGWLKAGYKFVEEEQGKSEEEIAEEFEKLREQADQFASEHPEMAGDLPTDDEIASNVAHETKLVVKEDRPFVDRVSPFDVFVDPEAMSLDDARWVAQRVVRDLEDVRRDQKYNAKARKDVVGSSVSVGAAESTDRWGRSSTKDADRVEVWEYYDLKHGTMCVFAQSGEGFLVDPMDQPYEFGHPFIMMRNYEIPDRFYPMGELEAIKDLQDELNKSRSQLMNNRKRYARKHLARRGAFDARGIAALESERDGEIIFVDESFQFSDAITPLPQESMDPQTFNYTQIIESDLTQISGVSEYARGAAPEIRRTATEASIIQDAANSRAADKLARVERAVSMVARRMVQLAQQYLTEAQQIRVVGKSGHVHFAEIEPEWIQGEYDFEVEAGSTQPQNEMYRRQQATQMLQAVAPFMVPGGPVNATEVLKHFFQYGLGIKDAEKFVTAEQQMNDPMTGEPLGAPPDEEEPPPDMDAPPPPDDGGGGPGAAPQGAVPDAIAAQLAGQVGLNVQ